MPAPPTYAPPFNLPSLLTIFCLIVLRIVQSLFVKTYFNPDEYWQNQEVAYDLAFSSPHPSSPSEISTKTWEWSPYAAIRGYLHPAFTAGIYLLLAALNLDTEWAIAWSPRISNAILCGIADFHLFSLAWRLLLPFHAETRDKNDDNDHNNNPNNKNQLPSSLPFLQLSTIELNNITTLTVIIWLSNWFAVFCYTRPFSNSVETSMLIIALSYWPFLNNQYYQTGDKQYDISTLKFTLALATSLILAALGVILRPTTVLVWFALYLHALWCCVWKPSTWTQKVTKLSLTIALPIAVGILALALLVEVDSIGYTGKSLLQPLSTCLYQQYLTHSGSWTSFPTQSSPKALLSFIKDQLIIQYITPCVINPQSTQMPRIMLSLYNFYRINKQYDIASLYGEHFKFFSVVVSIPVCTFVVLPFLIYSTIRAFSNAVASLFSNLIGSSKEQPTDIAQCLLVLYLAYFLPIFYGTNSHQEYRFILPAVPFMYVLAAWGIVKIWPSHHDAQNFKNGGTCMQSLKKPIFLVLIVINTGFLIYGCRWHQSGPVSVLEEISSIKTLIAQNNMVSAPKDQISNIGVTLLTSCHSMPNRSFVHKPIGRNSNGDRISDFVPHTHIFSPDCSPLFSNRQQLASNDGTNASIVNIPCRLSHEDQFAMLNTLNTESQSANLDKFPWNAYNCTSLTNIPHVPGKNWLSEHELIKQHVEMYFLRQVVLYNLVARVAQHEHVYPTHISSYTDFYNTAICFAEGKDRAEKAASKCDTTAMLRSLFKGLGKDVTSDVNWDQLKKIIQQEILPQLHSRTMNNIIGSFPALLSDQTLRSFVDSDPFSKFSHQFSLPTHVSSLSRIFFPDIVVLFNAEKDRLHELLTLFGFSHHSTHFHSHTEDEEQYFYIYTSAALTQTIRA